MINDILSEIQAKLKAPKSQYNAFGKYNYRNCEDILEAVKPILAEYKATITLSDSVQYIGDRYYVRAVACLGVGDEEIEIVAYAREEETKKGMDGSQITGASSSYARKYALNGLFAIDDTKDSDTTNVVENKPKMTNAPKNEGVSPTNAPKNENIVPTNVEEAKAYKLSGGKARNGLKFMDYKGKTVEDIYKNEDFEFINFAIENTKNVALKTALELAEADRLKREIENAD